MVAGTINGVVAVRGRSGLVLQQPKTFRRAISPAQAESMARMKQAGLAWNELSPASVAAWRAYAAGLTHRNNVTGQRFAPVAFNVFSGLFCKLLQMDPAAPVPVYPPQTIFFGDDLTVTVASTDEGVVYTASAPNQPGVLTEILYQRLPGPHRLPKPAYKSAGFASFQADSLSFTLLLDPGPYACAYQFVEASTGRTTLTMPLGTVTIS
ncbi:hypothetical protein EON82_16340 [bacterium]|nr:MAG: hypothetical protein EON82_16340 [bacterium]